MPKLKTCSFCGKNFEKLWYSNPKCCGNYTCKQKYHDNKEKGVDNKIIRNRFPVQKTKSNSSTRENKNKRRIRKPTGEYQLFLKLYAIRNGRCEITNEQIPFNVSSFAHILSKGAYPRYRLNPDNIIMVKTRIHELYDNSSKEKLLNEFPAAIVIYDKKNKLKYQYYNE